MKYSIITVNDGTKDIIYELYHDGEKVIRIKKQIDPKSDYPCKAIVQKYIKGECKRK